MSEFHYVSRRVVVVVVTAAVVVCSRGIVRGDSRTSSPTPGPETSKDPHLGTAEEGCPESDHDIEEPGVGKAERGHYRNRARTVGEYVEDILLKYMLERKILKYSNTCWKISCWSKC